MLTIHAEQQFTIGIVTRQPAAGGGEQALRNVPEEGALQLGSGRVLRHLPARHLLARPRQRAGRLTPRCFAIVVTPHPDDDPDAGRDQPRSCSSSSSCRPGDYLASYIAELQAQGEQSDPQKIAVPARALRPGQAVVEQYLQLGLRAWVGCGDFGYSFEYDLPVLAGDRRPDAADDPRVARHGPVHLGDRVPDRRLLGHAPVQLGRLRPDAARLPRPRDPELPARAGADVLRQRLVRPVDRRPHGPGVPRQAVELGQVQLGARAPLDPGHRDRHRRHRGHDPPPARQPARRAAEAVRRHRRAPRACRRASCCASTRCAWRSTPSSPTSAACCRT